MAHLSRGLMPLEVVGRDSVARPDGLAAERRPTGVEWLVNRTASGWCVTLMNPAGQDKPQHGITPTDYRQNKRVVIRSFVPITTAKDRLLPDDVLKVENGQVQVEVPAGGVRIVELK
jgi:hypothetical protein